MMEYGSDFHVCDFLVGTATLPSRIAGSRRYMSGRGALAALAQWRGYRRIYVPSYFCHESVSAIPGVVYYPYAPGEDMVSAIKATGSGRGDAVLVCNYWGLYTRPDYTGIDCEIIEDHTHDLLSRWALQSEAHWCIASLRKTLPIPDGGLLWSPVGRDLPPQPPVDSRWASAMEARYRAMDSKRRYLQGEPVDKAAFLESFGLTEEQFDDECTSDWSEHTTDIISRLDIDAWYAAKRSNREILITSLAPIAGCDILQPTEADATPFSLILLFESAGRREQVRRAPIAKDIYPAVLWRLPDGTYDPAGISGRMLSVHCDGRYSAADMRDMAGTLKEILVQ